MKHKFENVAILCTTDEQILHLATMAKSASISKLYHSGMQFVYFREVHVGANLYSNFYSAGGKPVVTYEEFIAGMQETKEPLTEDGFIELMRSKDMIGGVNEETWRIIWQERHNSNFPKEISEKKRAATIEYLKKCGLYSQFNHQNKTKQPATQVVEVTGCEDCPFYERDHKWEQFCRYPDKGKEVSMSENLFKYCPLKKGAVTIKLKEQ